MKLDDTVRDRLIAAARAIAGNAHAPYSRFAVGAAVLLEGGDVVTGANFENASYGLSLCAETVALASVSSAGRLGEVVALGVVGGRLDQTGVPRGGDPIRPCGRCRQVINEARRGDQPDIVIWCSGVEAGLVERHMLADLLPHAFGPADLGMV